MARVNVDKIEDSEIRAAVASYLDDLREDGTIRGPGKFEGEPLWTVYFHYWVLSGEGEDVFTCEDSDEDSEDMHEDADFEIEYTRFTIDATDAEIFPDLEPHIGKELRLCEDSQGFVHTWIMP